MRRQSFCLLTATLAVALCLPASAQHVHPAGEPAHDAADAAIGTLSFPTSTRSPQAQKAFETGVRWLHLFEYDNARASFAQAQKLDPGFALAYWGEAMTYFNSIWHVDATKEGRAALAKLAPTPAARAAKAPTAREKAFLDTTEKLFGPGTMEARQANFLASSAALASQYPDDDEAQLLHALALLGADPNGRNEANYAEAARLAGAVLARNRQHPGAAHFLIHAVDDPAHAAMGLDAARALADINPASAHAQHMTSHIFFGLGRWDDAIAANRAAVKLQEDGRKQKGLSPGRCGHAIDWLQYAYYQAGRVHEARQTLADCIHDAGVMTSVALLKPSVEANEMAQRQLLIQDSLLDLHITSLVEGGRDAVRDATLLVGMGAAGHFGGPELFARGYVAALAGNADKARAYLAALRAVAAQPPSDEESALHLGEYLEIQADMLQAVIDAHEGRMDAAVARVRTAAANSDALPFQFGPPMTAKPPHELLGELLLQQGKPADALAEFDKAQKSTPNRALTLLGRARALKATGDTTGAAQAFSQLAAQWHAADADLPVLAEVRAGAKPQDAKVVRTPE